MIVDKMTIDEMTVDKMTVDEMTVDEMSVDEMAWSHCSHTCPPTVNEIKLFSPFYPPHQISQVDFYKLFQPSLIFAVEMSSY
jgi:hypothetical protein